MRIRIGAFSFDSSWVMEMPMKKRELRINAVFVLSASKSSVLMCLLACVSMYSDVEVFFFLWLLLWLLVVKTRKCSELRAQPSGESYEFSCNGESLLKISWLHNGEWLKAGEDSEHGFGTFLPLNLGILSPPILVLRWMLLRWKLMEQWLAFRFLCFWDRFCLLYLPGFTLPTDFWIFLTWEASL